jgi:hypothetical protein
LWLDFLPALPTAVKKKLSDFLGFDPVSAGLAPSEKAKIVPLKSRGKG